MSKTKAVTSFTPLFFLLALFFFSGCGGGGGSSSSSPPAGITVTTSGLLGTGLVLENNDEEALEISENGSTNFSTPALPGSSYNVTVLSQPTDPPQRCEVINAQGTISANSENEPQVVCTTGFVETFSSNELDSGYWYNEGGFERTTNLGVLKYSLNTSSESVANYLQFRDTNCGTISTDVTVTGANLVGTGDALFGTRIQSCGYHTSTTNDSPESRTGDVNAAIIIENTDVFYQVFRCLNNDCDDSKSVKFLTPGTEGRVPLGTVAMGSTAKLLIDWDTLARGRFTFQMNDASPVSFNPALAGAPISSPAPNLPEKYMGPRLSLSNPDDIASMTANFDNVENNGIVYDDFEGTCLDGSLWKQTNGRLAVEGGRLIIETTQEYTGDLEADTRLYSTEERTHDDLVPNAAIVEAEFMLEPSTSFVDSGGRPVEMQSFLSMDFRPPDTDERDYTDSFSFEGRMVETPSGVVAEATARGCADASCTTTYPIANSIQTFNTSIASGEDHRFKIANAGGGQIEIVLDGVETISFDLSSIDGFASTEFTGIRIGTRSRGTDMPGETAFVRASFNNILLGNP